MATTWTDTFAVARNAAAAAAASDKDHDTWAGKAVVDADIDFDDGSMDSVFQMAACHYRPTTSPWRYDDADDPTDLAHGTGSCRDGHSKTDCVGMSA